MISFDVSKKPLKRDAWAGIRLCHDRAFFVVERNPGVMRQEGIVFCLCLR